MYTLNLITFSILLDGAAIYTVTEGRPVPQIAGELDDLVDAGALDRVTYRDLQRALWASEAGMTDLRTKAWQFGGAA